MTKRTVKNLSDVVLSEEDYAYDAAGNMTAAPDSTFSYDTNNRLTWYNGDAVSYDADGNMVTAVLQCDCPTYFEYDSANRLLSACGHTYTYNAEDVRIRNLCATEDTKYTYNTNCRLSKLLWKDTNGTVTKYVYGRGLIGEETGNAFKTYHFDCRGSTVALTDANGNITDTFEHDTYGGLISRTGTTAIIFGYNGRDGVVTDTNGLIYMRARYYSPDMRRFMNADIIHGDISDSTSLNRYAYVNGNPVSFIDPFGLEAQRGSSCNTTFNSSPSLQVQLQEFLKSYGIAQPIIDALINEFTLKALYEDMRYGILNEIRPNNIGQGVWADSVEADLKWTDDVFGASSKIAKVIDALGKIGVIMDVGTGVYENIQEGTEPQRIISDAIVDTGVSIGSGLLSTATALACVGALAGSVSPVVGNLIGAGIGFATGTTIYILIEVIKDDGESLLDDLKDNVYHMVEHSSDIAMISSTFPSVGGGGSYGLSCLIFGMKENNHLIIP